MEVFDDPIEFQNVCIEARESGDLGLVPTMGFLHEGHQRLMEHAVNHDVSALTIFVNPTQFAPTEDLARYPRDLKRDLAMAKKCGIDLVFTPTPESMYPSGFQTYVEVGPLAKDLEGAFRPTHFRGVATVVLKLFQLAQPTHAYFGRKDYQQLAIVRRMTKDFDLPIDVVGIPTVREPDGLAKSSRNAYLNAEERQRALGLSRGLNAAQKAFASGERSAAKLEALALAEVQKGTDSIDYVAVRDAESLGKIERAESGQAVVVIAARVGKTRLIDNAVLE